jgi:hypothetical protein
MRTLSNAKIEFIKSLESRGRIDAFKVIEAARSPDSPIHDEFEWDKDKAWEKYALGVAEALIRAVKVEIRVDHRTVSAVAYVKDPAQPKSTGTYMNITVAARNREKSLAILTVELSRVKSALKRAREVALVLGLEDELDEMLANVDRILYASEQPPDQPGASPS